MLSVKDIVFSSSESASFQPMVNVVTFWSGVEKCMWDQAYKRGKIS